MINHHISDLIARINNARNNYKSSKSPVKVVNTKENLAILIKLENEGFVKTPQIKNNEIIFSLNSIQKIKVISTPGRRIYRGWKDLHEGYSYITLIRTSQGILTTSEAIIQKLGGEMILKIRGPFTINLSEPKS